jgi:hypothetical protein
MKAREKCIATRKPTLALTERCTCRQRLHTSEQDRRCRRDRGVHWRSHGHSLRLRAAAAMAGSTQPRPSGGRINVCVGVRVRMGVGVRVRVGVGVRGPRRRWASGSAWAWASGSASAVGARVRGGVGVRVCGGVGARAPVSVGVGVRVRLGADVRVRAGVGVGVGVRRVGVRVRAGAASGSAAASGESASALARRRGRRRRPAHRRPRRCPDPCRQWARGCAPVVGARGCAPAVGVRVRVGVGVGSACPPACAAAGLHRLVTELTAAPQQPRGFPAEFCTGV